MKVKIEGVDLTISKLEYFAGEALRGILANPNPNIKSEMVAEMAIVYAEEMLCEFKKLDKGDRLYENNFTQK